MSARRLGRMESRLETRRRVLAAATEVFARRGFTAAALEEIAEAAGYTKGAVYYNFTDKEGLFLALLEDRVEANLQAVVAILDRHGQGSDQDSALDATIEQLRAHDPQWCLLMTEFWFYAMRNPTVQARLAVGQHRLHGLVVDLFQRQCDRHGVTSAVPLGDPGWFCHSILFESGLRSSLMTMSMKFRASRRRVRGWGRRSGRSQFRPGWTLVCDPGRMTGGSA